MPFLALALVSCSQPAGMVKVSEAGPLAAIVVDRTAAYASAPDAGLDSLETSELAFAIVAVREELIESPLETVPASSFAPELGSVLRYHDLFVAADGTISLLERDRYLRSSSILSGLLDAALPGGPD